MIEDREELPAWRGVHPQDARPRSLPAQPAPSCDHARGRCDCDDDGTGAAELHPETEVR